MAIKIINNSFSEKAEMFFDSAAIGIVLANTANPAAGLLAPIMSVMALPFAAHNTSLVNKQIKTIIDEFNKLETRVDNFIKATEEQKDVFLLNEYKFFDYCLKEKMKEKIEAYAKVFSKSINDFTAFEENDEFDIKMDIINALRLEDVELCRYIIGINGKIDEFFTMRKFTEDEINGYIISKTNKKQELNRFALRHLLNLGLIDEELITGFNVNGSVLTTDTVRIKYRATTRFKMIYESICSN